MAEAEPEGGKKLDEGAYSDLFNSGMVYIHGGVSAYLKILADLLPLWFGALLRLVRSGKVFLLTHSAGTKLFFESIGDSETTSYYCAKVTCNDFMGERYDLPSMWP